MPFWKNSELVRYARAELRPARAMTSAMLALVICTLVGLSSWAAMEQGHPKDFFQTFYLWMMGMQFVVLTFWCVSSCGHAISRERELKTYDFLKTTRLTPSELMLGKLLGVPILAYFTVGCTVPVSIVVGLMGGYSVNTIFWTYVLLVALALFVSIVALWASMQVEGTSARSVSLLIVVPIALFFGFAETPFPGVGAISIFPALISLHKANTDIARVVPTLFGAPVSFTLITLVLYASLGAWFALMLIRNLKKEIDEIRLLTRWQAIGFAAFLNILFFAFLNPQLIQLPPAASPFRYYPRPNTIAPQDVASFAVGLNALILIVIGLALLAPHEKLKVWWRKHAAGEVSYFSPSGPPWPWLIPAAMIAFAMLVAEALGLERSIPLSQWRLGTAALQLLVALVFVTRDILFIQWANLTRMKRPVFKGILYLWLYYTAAGILVGVFSVASTIQSRFLLGVLTPFSVFILDNPSSTLWPGIYVGLFLQLALIVLLLRVLSVRLSRPAIVPALSEG